MDKFLNCLEAERQKALDDNAISSDVVLILVAAGEAESVTEGATKPSYLSLCGDSVRRHLVALLRLYTGFTRSQYHMTALSRTMARFSHHRL